MVSNAGRMVAAMAMINGSVEPRLRGGFMSAYSSVQHIAAGVGAFVAGLIIAEAPDGSHPTLLAGRADRRGLDPPERLARRQAPTCGQAVNPRAEPMDELIEVVPAAEAF